MVLLIASPLFRLALVAGLVSIDAAAFNASQYKERPTCPQDSMTVTTLVID
ncbi:hypothetical protein [Adlercreutzia mucosicola]|uniref:hypothetical protein n=1 Tax=Adlercreutzia mucosicola TaxID=580026 RepID=UPI00214B5946|nr:hypothetical protein [Adlercreutzia mucosicola]